MSSLSTPGAASASTSKHLPLPPALNHGLSAGDSSVVLRSPPSTGGDEGLVRGCRSVGVDGEGGQEHLDGGRKKVLNPFAQEFVPGPPHHQPDAGEGFRATAGVSDDGVSHGDEAGKQIAGPISNPPPNHAGGLTSSFGGNRRGSRCKRGNSQAPAPASAPIPAASSGGRRGQMLNANHLLNFQYDRFQRPPSRPAPPQRGKQKQRPQPYNKELFLQANFRFLVSDLGDYAQNASDPDKMLEWEDVAAVNVLAPQPLQCPICLDSPPVCPQITSCGHTFCFPCILRYMMMGEENPSGDYYKKCPLCFAMISCKEMRTVSVHSVKQYEVGDVLKFTLLVRRKDSIIPFESRGRRSSLSYSTDGYCQVFSKFSLTSDAEQTTNKALSELKEWMERVQVEGSNEDLELLPYGLAATEQVQRRKVAWGQHRASEFLSSSPNVRQRIMAQAKAGEQLAERVGNLELEGQRQSPSTGKGGFSRKVDVAAETEAALAELRERAGWVYESAFSDDEGEEKPEGRVRSSNQRNLVQWEQWVPDHGVEVAEGKEAEAKEDAGDEEAESYYFYQAADGQSLILHPLNMKCLLQHFRTYEALPSSIQAKLVELEAVTQTEAARKRFRYLSHLPLTTTFYLCEVDLRDQIPATAFHPFSEELRIRQNRRQRVEQLEKQQRKEEQRLAAATASAKSVRFPHATDFVPIVKSANAADNSEVLDTGAVQPGSAPSPSPPGLEERKRFSSVAKLGYASGHDAPNLSETRAVDASSPSQSSETGGSSGATPLTFAAIIQAQVNAKPSQEESQGLRGSGSGKKTKKGVKVLLSTAGGRRY